MKSLFHYSRGGKKKRKKLYSYAFPTRETPVRFAVNVEKFLAKSCLASTFAFSETLFVACHWIVALFRQTSYHTTLLAEGPNFYEQHKNRQRATSTPKRRIRGFRYGISVTFFPPYPFFIVLFFRRIKRRRPAAENIRRWTKTRPCTRIHKPACTNV